MVLETSGKLKEDSGPCFWVTCGEIVESFDGMVMKYPNWGCVVDEEGAICTSGAGVGSVVGADDEDVGMVDEDADLGMDVEGRADELGEEEESTIVEDDATCLDEEEDSDGEGNGEVSEDKATVDLSTVDVDGSFCVRCFGCI